MKVPVPIRCIRVVTETIDAASPNYNRSEFVVEAFKVTVHQPYIDSGEFRPKTSG